MDKELKAGQEAPEFTLPATNGSTISLSEYRGQKVVLYFYSKDNTAGCTAEAHEFREVHAEIAAYGAVILGISRDSLSTHEKFADKHELPYLLLSDTDSTICRLYGVLKEKTMYGKKVMGIERSTFVIDEQGKISHVFRKVKVDGHARAVLAVLTKV